MKSILPIKRLYRIAIYTSTAIGLITMGPVYLVAHIMGNIPTTPIILSKLLGSTVTGISFFVFIIWVININLLKYTSNKPKLSGTKKSRYIFSYLVCFSIMLSIRLATLPITNNPERVEHILNWKIKQFGMNPDAINYMQFNNVVFQILIMFFVIISINTVVLIIQDLVLLLENKSRIESENTRLKIINIEATNQKLKQQLQPHFLFNSLNVLKTLIKKQPENAEVYVKKLSDFLRASVSYDRVNTVKVKEELKFGTNYLEMQKIRFNDALHFEVNISEEAQTGQLPIFSIQLLLENAIKHNAFTIDSPLYIKITHHEEWITVTNNYQQKVTEENYSGMGLMNLSERYKIISGDEIDIQASETSFSVSIKIIHNANSNHRG